MSIGTKLSMGIATTVLLVVGLVPTGSALEIKGCTAEGDGSTCTFQCIPSSKVKISVSGGTGSVSGSASCSGNTIATCNGTSSCSGEGDVGLTDVSLGTCSVTGSGAKIICSVSI